MAGRQKSGGVEETNRRLGRIEDTLTTASKVFELMHERLERLDGGQQALVEGQQSLVAGQRSLVEGQRSLVEGQRSLVEGQRFLVEGQRSLVEGQRSLIEGQERVIERLDRLVESSMRDRTAWVERFGRVEQRLERVEAEVFPGGLRR